MTKSSFSITMVSILAALSLCSACSSETREAAQRDTSNAMKTFSNEIDKDTDYASKTIRNFGKSGGDKSDNSKAGSQAGNDLTQTVDTVGKDMQKVGAAITSRLNNAGKSNSGSADEHAGGSSWSQSLNRMDQNVSKAASSWGHLGNKSGGDGTRSEERKHELEHQIGYRNKTNN